MESSRFYTYKTDSVSTGKGEHGEIFYISIECAAGTCATAPAHSTSFSSHNICNATKQAVTDKSLGWEDVSITLSKADQSFGHTGDWEQGATGGKMSTTDGGKTWNFTTLNVPDTDVPRS